MNFTLIGFAFTVLLLFWMGFFTLGSLPLMILKHDTLLDARFIRGLFDVYYKAVMVVSTGGAASYALARHPVSATAMCVIFLVAYLSRRAVLPRMDSLRTRDEPMEPPQVRSFRRLHVGGMALNFTQLIGLCFGMSRMGL
ncbi:hypothetical protein [Ramlibacter sp. PS4R-6]|uniref:hypothetical protein n=1 Tax=Ramlibacter sp. PS4R-6 TaxID=3133438 RepID=UPI0030AF9D32